MTNRSRTGETGQGAAEFGLALALLVIIALIALIFLGSHISGNLGPLPARV
ncbi:MAG: hypothetical protein ACP5VP_05655 [Candidatus Limnocylindrales bacterium]